MRACWARESTQSINRITYLSIRRFYYVNFAVLLCYFIHNAILKPVHFLMNKTLEMGNQKSISLLSSSIYQGLECKVVTVVAIFFILSRNGKRLLCLKRSQSNLTMAIWRVFVVMVICITRINCTRYLSSGEFFKTSLIL